MKKLFYILVLFAMIGCKQTDAEGYSQNASFLVVKQINPSYSNNPFICEYRMYVFNTSEGIQSHDGFFGVYDTIGKFKINDTIYLRKVFLDR